MNPEHIAAAFLAACRAELDALKVGNVHRFSAGHGMEVEHFELAAEAAAPHIAAKGARVGTRIETAVAASLIATGLNTNLGIVLLCAPLAAAAEAEAPLSSVLDGLNMADARATFRAIALANPGGLGRHEHDVATPPTISLMEAMAMAASRDRIARQYVSGFRDIYDIGVAQLDGLAGVEEEARTEAVHLGFMAAFADSHIARKFGPEIAEQVRLEAEQLASTIDWRAPAAIRRQKLMAFDTGLKTRGLNPGTSADLTVATLFASALKS